MIDQMRIAPSLTFAQSTFSGLFLVPYSRDSLSSGSLLCTSDPLLFALRMDIPINCISQARGGGTARSLIGACGC